MSNFFTDNDDLQWYIDKGIDWEPVVDANEHGFKYSEGPEDVEEATEFYRDILTMFGEFIGQEIAPHTEELDREGVLFTDGEASFPPRLESIFQQMKELDIHGMCLPRELGGVNAPVLLYNINNEMLARADQSVMTHYSFHGGMALAMLLFSIEEGKTEFDREAMKITSTDFETEIGEIARGEAWACMDITEPDAGSDMGALRTFGEQDEAGNWFVSGQKIFITSGHGKYHFVIARTEKDEDPENPFSGLKGLSMFLVKTYDENPDGTRTWHARIDRVEEKLGHHASVTASILFERSPARLIGEPGDGFKHMLALMNGARVTVGFQSIGLCEAAFRLARDYAAERQSMGKTIDRHELIADMLEEMRTDIQGLRALAMYCGVHNEIAEKENLRLQFAPPDDEVEKRRLQKSVKWHQRRVRRSTPLLKYLAAEKAVELSRKCLQIHGGNGYTKDYGAEKLLRDSLVLPIYEGTSQIQGLMATKDTLNGILQNPQAFIRRRAQAQWNSVSARDVLERRVARIQAICYSAQQYLLTRLARQKFASLHGKPIGSWPKAFFKDWDPKKDFAFALLHAEHLTQLLADTAICRILLEQSQEHPERRGVLVRYLERAEPRCRYMAARIHSSGGRLLEELDGESEEQQATG